ncbi:unnamed protein product [Diamesa tonsa]
MSKAQVLTVFLSILFVCINGIEDSDVLKLCYEECPKNEIFTECEASCDTGCGGTLTNRTLMLCGCTHGCICKPGFIRNTKTKRCIPESSCLQLKGFEDAPNLCKSNEVFSENGANCQLSCSTKDLGKLIKCRPASGCICKKGFIRNPINGRCIPESWCPKCPQNKVWLPCTKGSQEHCGLCVCKPGYVEYIDSCVKDCAGRDCSNTEVYSTCGNCEENCTDDPRKTCDKTGCHSGCFCKSGYKRDSITGNCILKTLCPAQCPLNEHYECGNRACEKTCNNLDKLCTVANIQCENGCYCDNGYAREKGVCIRKSDCPRKKCEKNEFFSTCRNVCHEPSCEQRVGTVCMDCQVGCYCKKGYARDITGKCIRESKCPSICGVNEVFNPCGSNCVRDCQHLLINYMCIQGCSSGCFCQNGFIRNKPNGKCVKEDQCPDNLPPMTCSKNEIYNACGSLSSEPTCDVPIVVAQAAPAADLKIVTPVCEAGCYCKKGFFRNNKGKCVKEQNCIKTQCGEHEIFTNCGSGCGDLTCDNPTLEGRFCPAVCRVGCACKPGFVRNNEGKCIREKQCPPHSLSLAACSGKNEVFSDCGCNDLTCDSRFKVCPIVCRSGCYCAAGFVRNAENVCIAQAECQETQCGEHEIFTNCGSGCGDLTCDNPTLEGRFCPAVCRVGCACKPGFVRNNEGKCIREKQCPQNKCNKNNESWKCGVKTCEAVCDQPINEVCTYSKFSCMDGCFCKDGFIRASMDGPCIPEQKCKKLSDNNCNAATEKFVLGVKACENVCGTGVDPACASTTYKPSKACFCKNGFIRDINGQCIPSTDCAPIRPIKPINPILIAENAPVPATEVKPAPKVAPAAI